MIEDTDEWDALSSALIIPLVYNVDVVWRWVPAYVAGLSSWLVFVECLI